MVLYQGFYFVCILFVMFTLNIYYNRIHVKYIIILIQDKKYQF